MNPFFLQHLKTAEKVNGIKFDALADWPELLELHRLAEVVTNAESKGNAALVRPCVEIGGQLFHRMSIGAGEWYAAACKWFEASPMLATQCLAYACAGARDPESMLWPYGSSKARLEARLKEWREALACTPDELVSELCAFLEETKEDQPQAAAQDGQEDAKPSGFGYMIDLLLSEYGGTPEQWIWHTPRETVAEQVGKIAERRRAQAGKGRADPNDPRVIASDRFIRKLAALVEKKKGAAHGPQV